MFSPVVDSVSLLALMGLGPAEMAIVGVLAVLLFGKNLPSVARSLGSSYREFRKGLSEFQSTLNTSDIYSSTPASSSYTPTPSHDDYDDYDQPQAPKFEAPPVEAEANSGDASDNGDTTRSDSA